MKNPLVLRPLLLAVLCFGAGVPVALVLAGSRRVATAASTFVVEAVVYGLSWFLLVGVVLAHRHQLGRANVLAPTLILDVVMLGLLQRRAAGPGVVARPRVTVLGLFVTATFVAGALLRTRPSYFLYQISDFGEYVNRGNVVAHGGDFTQWFTHGFSVLLALSHVVLGQGHEVDVMPFLGLTVMATLLATAEAMGAGAWPRGVMAVVLAIGVVPVWFSTFPASETFYALLLVAMLLALVLAVRAGHAPTAVVGGLLGFPLMLTRGNAMLLFPLLPVVLLVAVLVARRQALSQVVWFTAAATAGLFAGFVYDSRYSAPYFVTYQMPRFFPKAVWQRVDDLGHLGTAAWKGLVVAALVAGVLRVAVLANRHFDRSWERPWARWARVCVLPALVVVAAILLVAPLDAGGLRDALGRYDAAVYVLGVLGLAALAVGFGRSMSDEARVGAVFAVVVATAFALLHAYRFPTPRYAPYFLYWDRYLWSEFLPMLVLVGAWGSGAIVAGLARLRPRRALQAGAGAVVGLAAVVGTWAMWDAGAVAREHRFLGDPYADLQRLDRLTGGLPIVYVGVAPDEVPAAMGNPNTYRMFATPLTETFGRQVLDIAGLRALGPDPRPTPEQVMAFARSSGSPRVTVIQVVGRDPMIPGVAPRGTVQIAVPMLDRPIGRQPRSWRVARFELAVGVLEVR